jgi:hypothetical protein
VICDTSSYNNLELSNHQLIITVTDHEGVNINNENLENANEINEKYIRWENSSRARFLHKFLRLYIKQKFACDDFKNFPLQSECHNNGVICALSTIREEKTNSSTGQTHTWIESKDDQIARLNTLFILFRLNFPHHCVSILKDNEGIEAQKKRKLSQE